MNLIVAVDKNWAIGNNNELLVSIPDDMKFFREHTTGNVIIMGKKTLESFPGKRPLKNRVNIVITKNQNYKVDGAIVVHSIEEAVEKAKGYKHMTFREAAALARDANVKELWLTHYSPSLIHPEEYMDMVRGIFPNAWPGKDGKSVELNFEED